MLSNRKEYVGSYLHVSSQLCARVMCIKVQQTRATHLYNLREGSKILLDRHTVVFWRDKEFECQNSSVKVSSCRGQHLVVVQA